MPSSTLAQRYTINGVVNTENPVMENLDQLARSSGCFITYDTHAGQWGVVINTVSSSVASFDDSNIIGPINVTTTSLFDLYNQIEVEFPLLDTADKTDYVRINTSNAERSINEPDNLMKMTLNYCTEPVQAYLLGNIELNQSRLDKVATFQSDYSALALNAGDVIDVTNDLYQFTNKPFRIITIKEIDGSDGDLRSEITALEYDANIYSTTNTPRTVRTDLTGIQTLGAMTAPTVTINKFESAARPYIDVVSTVPSGIIEGVECWISSNGTNYNLRQTIKNADTILTPGGSITFTFDDQPAGNVYAKTRGTNYSVAGPFSNVANTVYAPVQVTDAIGNNTSILNSSGVPLSLLLALPQLLKGVDTYMNGNSNLANSIGGQISSSGAIVPITASFEVDPLDNTGNGLPPWAGGTNPYVTTQNLSFTVPATGTYRISMAGNFGNTSANSANTAKRIDIAVVAGNTHGIGNVVITDGTSSTNNMFDDLNFEFLGNLTVSTNYHLEMSYGANAGDAARFTSQVTSAGNNIWKNY